jgi:3-oxoacyl-[acyl-carrier protein] reductase
MVTGNAQVAFVTGGSGGIGRAICATLAEAGLRVGVGYFEHRDRAHDLASALVARGFSAEPFPVDVTSEASVTATVAECADRLGGLTVLVNNAGGMSMRHALENMPMSLWEGTLALNLTGSFLCSRAALPFIRASGGGHVVNIASSSILTGGSGHSIHYAAAKAGLIGLTRGLAREWAPLGIRVNAVAPGAVLTEFHERVPPATDPASWSQVVPLGRTGTPKDVANVVAFLVTDPESFITGQVIHVSGGMVLG